MFVLWKEPKLSDESITDRMFHHFYIGKSLGYTEKNIQYFLNKNIKNTLTEAQLKKIKTQMDTDRYSLVDMSPLKDKTYRNN